MKKGIGPQGLGVSKSPAKMYNSPAKSVEIVYKNKKDQVDATNEKLKKTQERSSSKAAQEMKQGKVQDIKDGVELRKRGYNTSLGRPKVNIK